jgi:predicted nucleic acid-binding protein
MPGALLDTGPLAAYLYPRDTYHDWAVRQFEAADAPFLTCEAVLTEACFLAARNGQAAISVLQMFSCGVVRISLDIEEELPGIEALMKRYANVPMSLADACLVRMAEMKALPICTLDSDFAIYRAQRRRPLNLISPYGAHGLHEP